MRSRRAGHGGEPLLPALAARGGKGIVGLGAICYVDGGLASLAERCFAPGVLCSQEQVLVSIHCSR